MSGLGVVACDRVSEQREMLMSYRPYPNAERALRRVRRGRVSSSPARALAVVPSARRVSRAEVAEAFPVGLRVMSTRRADG